MKRPRGNGFLQPVCVDLVREPGNEYDANAVAASIDGAMVGYLGREYAEQLAPHMDRQQIAELRICGVVRGGSPDADFLGVHVWPERRLAGGLALPHLASRDMVSWPPYEDEGKPD